MTSSPTLSAALGTAARAVADRVGPSVVRIGRHGGRGAGVVLADGLVLTNAHNLHDRTTLVTFADGRATQGEATAIDPEGDLAVLAVDTAGAPALAWSDAGAAPGDVVFTVGTARHGGVRLTFGMVSGVDRAFRGPRGRRIAGAVEHTAPLPRGSSGGPLVDEEGHLLGLNTARLGDGFYLALPADADLRERVDTLARGEAPHHRRLGIGVAPPAVARRLRASVGLPERDGLLVRIVEPGGPAERAGIQPGDLVIEAAGQQVASVDDLHDVLDRLEAGASLTLRILRGVEELDVTVAFEPT